MFRAVRGHLRSEGSLVAHAHYWLAFRDRPVPDARVAIYPFKREFVVVRRRSTRRKFLDHVLSARPAHAERECWYINMGAIDKDFCTVKSMWRRLLKRVRIIAVWKQARSNTADRRDAPRLYFLTGPQGPELNRFTNDGQRHIFSGESRFGF